MSTVTAILPTFDRAEWVERALASILAQTRPADEILIVDDGSRDETLKRLRPYERQEMRLRILSQEHAGVSAARNHAIRQARGDWLAFLDSDDTWGPEKLAIQLEQLASKAQDGTVQDGAAEEGHCAVEPGYWICHTDEIWIRNGRRVNPRQRHTKRGGYIFQHCLPLCAISPSAVMIHRRVFDRVGWFDESLPACEDYDLWLRICSRYPVLYVDQPLTIKHGGHEDQLSRRIPALDRYRIQALVKILDAGHLDEADFTAATRMLLEKIRVYRQGAEKRGRLDEVRELDRLAERHGSPLLSS